MSKGHGTALRGMDTAWVSRVPIPNINGLQVLLIRFPCWSAAGHGVGQHHLPVAR